MSIQLDVWSDFVCPWCYLAYTSVEKLAASHDVAVTWHSYELLPHGAPPMPREKLQMIQDTLPRLKHIAQTQYGLTLDLGPLGIHSRAAHVGAKYAMAQGETVGKAFHDAVYKAYWERAQDISQVDVLVPLAESVGLDAGSFRAALADATYIAQVEQDEGEALTMQISGVPALVFERKYLIPGAQPYEELVRVVDYIKQREPQA